MKISKIKIQNFRGIAEFEKDFLNPFTGKPLDTIVFAGPNGSGKTSILEAIVTTLSKPKAKDDKVHSRPFNRNDQDYHVEIKLIDGQNSSSVVANKANKHTLNTHQSMYDNRIDYFSSWREPRLMGALNVALGKRGNRPQDIEANRLWNLKQFLINSYVAEKLTQEQQEQQEQIILQEIAPNKHQKINIQMKNALSYFFPGSEIDIQIRQVGPSLEDGFDVFLKYPNSNGAYISLDNLSSGEIEIFSFLSSILRKDLSDGILIIDEPELHLHASWHRIILNALRELLPNTQIICASHSLEIIDSVMSYELIILGDDDDYQVKGHEDG